MTSQIAKQFSEVYFGGNWTAVNLKQTLNDVDWQQATTKIHSFNTIAALVYHINYYVAGVLKYLQGEPLEIRDKFSFEHPPVESQQDWQRLLDKGWTDAEDFARVVEQLPDSRLDEIFVNENYGSYYRNLSGIVEHAHYHLGQIVIIKKLISRPAGTVL
jgi:hypothetical protein